MDLRGLLEDILENAQRARSFVGEMSFEAFVGDARTRLAVERAAEIIGEATKRVPPAFRDQHPGIPWRRMAGMRDVISHQYRAVSPQVIYEMARRDVGILIETLPALIADLDAD